MPEVTYEDEIMFDAEKQFHETLIYTGRYIPVEGDLLDQCLGDQINLKQYALPIVRVKQNKYLIGTELVILMKQGVLINVRIGRSLMRFEQYLSKVERLEKDKIKMEIKRRKVSCKIVILELLIKFGAPIETIERYQAMHDDEFPKIDITQSSINVSFIKNPEEPDQLELQATKNHLLDETLREEILVCQ
ncbi:gas2 domain containing protein [Stylonychia lemnae]|uniref:Gas2 domain containing protein n=1 Tax=Stylonychia lemnae TaxID=5949 RepID=A0A078ANZ0_STYLE|nr:gas2 domain containing protein [Stylonychia lemnae]|eukprot:CDW83864.1 gas2 domain containing protein [Stylonychia lemnae]